MHIYPQPDFSTTPLTSSDDVNNWLNFYDMDPTLICVGELVSHDPVCVRLCHWFEDKKNSNTTYNSNNATTTTTTDNDNNGDTYMTIVYLP